MDEDIKDSLLLEKVNQALAEPESIDDRELEELMNNEEFVSLYRMAVNIRRAKLEKLEMKDKQIEIRNEKQDTISHISPITSRIIPLLAVAASIALLFVFLHKEKQQVEKSVSPNQLYAAEQPADDITIMAGSRTISMKSLTNNQATARQMGIQVEGDEIKCDPTDLSDYEITSTTVILPQGKVAKIVLPDGSRVWLNARSSLIYPNKFLQGQPRNVQLKGEAYFEVARDASRPFIVDCEYMQTRVLGTAFNVRSYQGEEPRVTLVSGSVKVSAHNRHILMQPNQTVCLDADGIMRVDSLDVQTLTCWRDELFYFDGQTLRDIMIEIGRWYNMDVLIESDEHLNDRLHFNGERQWTIHELIEQMNMVCRTKIRVQGNTIRVF